MTVKSSLQVLLAEQDHVPGVLVRIGGASKGKRRRRVSATQRLVEHVLRIPFRFFGEIKLGDASRLLRPEVEMDVRRAMAYWGIVSARLDRHEAPLAFRVGTNGRIALEVGIERRTFIST